MKYPIFFLGSIMMMAPGILIHYYNVLTILDYEWSVGLGFLLFCLSMIIGPLERLAAHG
ncbi:MAG: hypothetical protein M1151_07060 [Candidatus Thermoplasmatota archaeon]|nr:hypothetical protein [Candidatus Thermoplasmatota archaeon]